MPQTSQANSKGTHPWQTNFFLPTPAAKSPLGSGDDYFLASGVTHYTDTGNALAISGTGDNNVAITGALVGFGSAVALSILTGAENVNVTIASSGSVFGTNTGSSQAIRSLQTGTVVTNMGTVSANTGVFLGGDDAAVNNSGTISGVASDVNFIFSVGVEMGGDNAQVLNSGIIQGGTGINAENNATINNSGDILGVRHAINTEDGAPGARFQIINSGTISVGESNSAFANYAVNGGNGTEEITNTGTILGDIDLDAGDDTIDNTGTITGDIDLGTGDDVVSNAGLILGTITGDATFYTGIFNSGTIDGNVFLTGATSEMYNSGLITGSVSLGDSADIYAASGNGQVGGIIFGNGGDDTLSGGTQNDAIQGGAGEDTLEGGSGEDVIHAGSGNDLLNGGSANDVLSGNAGEDTLNGDLGDDVLRGGSGSDELNGGADGDKLFGGAGDDLITGGEGRDVLRGNAGADTFIYLAQTDSTLADSDRIRDFELGLGRIDVSELEEFLFVGSASFSGTGAEIRYQVTGTGVRVEMDLDGDGNADMRINMNNIDALNVDDFIL